MPRIGEGRHRGIGLDDPCFFPRNARGGFVGCPSLGFEQECLVIDTQRGDPADRRGRDDVRRIEPPAEADLDDAIVGGDACEGEEGGGGGDFEKARLHTIGFVEHLFEQCREQRVVDERPGETDAFVEANEMRAGIAVDLAPARFEDRAEIGAGRSLAIGARDMEGARELVLRIAEARAQFGDALEPEDVAARR